MNLLLVRDGIWTQQFETLCVFNVELYPAKSGITFCAMRVCVICHLATMTTPFTGLFIDASCNSRSSHGQVHTVQYRTITTGIELWGPFLPLL
jgi:hypothetical protein